MKDAIVEKGGLPPLIKLLNSLNVMILKGATTAIANLTSTEDGQRQMVCFCCFPGTKLLHSEQATSCSNFNAQIELDVLDPLVFLGRKSKNPEVQFRVALAFNNLCANEELHDQIKEAGAVPALRHLARSRDPETKREGNYYCPGSEHASP